MFYIRLFLIVVGFLVVSICGTFYSIVKWRDPNINCTFGHILSRMVLVILGLRVEVQGLEHLGVHQPGVFVANHQSSFDMATFGHVFPNRTVLIGKKELLLVPLFGIFFVAARNIVIDRKKREKAVAGLSQAVDAIRNQSLSIWMFPEGTRNPSGTGLLPFKKGAFHMAIQAGVPILPMVCGSLKPFVSIRERRLRGGVIRLKILAPVKTTGFSREDVAVLIAEVHDQMSVAFKELSV